MEVSRHRQTDILPAVIHRDKFKKDYLPFKYLVMIVDKINELAAIILGFTAPTRTPTLWLAGIETMKADIKPISYIKTNAADMMKYINDTHSPSILPSSYSLLGCAQARQYRVLP